MKLQNALLAALALLLFATPAMAQTVRIAGSNWFTATPTITAGAYTTNQSIGGLTALTFTGSRVAAITLNSKQGLATPKGFCLFFANPSGSTFTDHGTYTIATADLSKVAGCGSLLSPLAFAGQTPTSVTGSFDFPIPPNGKMWIAFYEGTTGDTFSSTSDLVENFGVE